MKKITVSPVAKAHFAIMGANIIYGLNYVIAKGIMPDYMSPRAIIMMRVLGASFMFWLIDYIRGGEKVDKKDLIKFFYLSFFGVALSNNVF